MYDHASDNPSPYAGWSAQLVLEELHRIGSWISPVNLAGRCFLPADQVDGVLLDLERAGLVTQRGRRWRAHERRAEGTGASAHARRRERREFRPPV